MAGGGAAIAVAGVMAAVAAAPPPPHPPFILLLLSEYKWQLPSHSIYPLQYYSRQQNPYNVLYFQKDISIDHAGNILNP